MATNKTVACRGRNPPKTMEMDCAHASHSTRQKEVRHTKKMCHCYLEADDWPHIGTAGEIGPGLKYVANLCGWPNNSSSTIKQTIANNISNVSVIFLCHVTLFHVLLYLSYRS